jgi:hypothetical protein
MIGGTDITIPTVAGAAALDFCLRVTLEEWPNAVFEDANTGRRFNEYQSLPLGHLTEVFVFQDQKIAGEWDEHGARPELENTMLHIILSESSITLVMDDPTSSTMQLLLAAIRDGLHMDILNTPAKVQVTFGDAA